MILHFINVKRRKSELETVLKRFYQSEFRNISIDRYIRVCDGTFLLFKKAVYVDGFDLYRHFVVPKHGEIYAACPMLNRFNPFIIKKIPKELLQKKNKN